jgi:hypothetical protein
VDCICPISGSSLSPIHCQPFCLSSLCLLKVRVEINALLLSPSLVCSEHPTPSAECSFSVPCLLFRFLSFFLWGGGSVCPGGYAGLSQGCLWEYCVQLICSPVGLPLPSRFGASVLLLRSPPVFSV